MTQPTHRSARPAISCVVPAFNEAANFCRLVTGLTAQHTLLTDCWEVVVFDGGRNATPAATKRRGEPRT